MEKTKNKKTKTKTRQIKYDAKSKRYRRAHSDVTSPSLGERWR
jgi:hypothetical protein